MNEENRRDFQQVDAHPHAPTRTHTHPHAPTRTHLNFDSTGNLKFIIAIITILLSCRKLRGIEHTYTRNNRRPVRAYRYRGRVRENGQLQRPRLAVLIIVLISPLINDNAVS